MNEYGEMLVFQVDQEQLVVVVWAVCM